MILTHFHRLCILYRQTVTVTGATVVSSGQNVMDGVVFYFFSTCPVNIYSCPIVPDPVNSPQTPINPNRGQPGQSRNMENAYGGRKCRKHISSCTAANLRFLHFLIFYYFTYSLRGETKPHTHGSPGNRIESFYLS